MFGLCRGEKTTAERNFDPSKMRSIRFSAGARPTPKSFHRGTFWLHLLGDKRWNYCDSLSRAVRRHPHAADCNSQNSFCPPPSANSINIYGNTTRQSRAGRSLGARRPAVVRQCSHSRPPQAAARTIAPLCGVIFGGSHRRCDPRSRRR